MRIYNIICVCIMYRYRRLLIVVPFVHNRQNLITPFVPGHPLCSLAHACFQRTSSVSTACKREEKNIDEKNNENKNSATLFSQIIFIMATMIFGYLYYSSQRVCYFDASPHDSFGMSISIYVYENHRVTPDVKFCSVYEYVAVFQLPLLELMVVWSLLVVVLSMSILLHAHNCIPCYDYYVFQLF